MHPVHTRGEGAAWNHYLPPKNLAGAPKQFMADPRRYAESSPGLIKENTVWDVYNNEARKVDHELVKDWRESLHSLLLFVSTSVTERSVLILTRF